MTKVVTRFAPSPTGYLHIGGGRTALFNWLFSRHHQGTFLLRIEDTDRARSTKEAVDAILDSLKWMGLDWDGDPVFQFSRMKRHAEVAHELVAKGQAYFCTCTPEDLTKMREEQKAQGKPVGYNQCCRDKGHTSGAIRIKAKTPHQENEAMTVSDLVQGDVHVSLSKIDDFILLRSNGTPTYMLSVVVDDHDMSITHIIRGDDHLNNAFRQNNIYNAMGWTPPEYAHIPLIHGPDGAKLSKRHGAVGLEAYRDMGYLPEAMRNYLLRLGWGHGDTDIISTEDAVRLFDLKDIGRSPSRIDFTKLASVNAHYMRQYPEEKLMTLLLPFIEKLLGEKPDEAGIKRLEKGLHDLKERAHTLKELAQAGLFYVHRRPLPINEAANKKLDRPLLGEIRQSLASLEDFKSDTIEAALKEFSIQKELKLGKVAMPLRAALTGTTSSPSIFHVAEILGKEETLARLDDLA